MPHDNIYGALGDSSKRPKYHKNDEASSMLAERRCVPWELCALLFRHSFEIRMWRTHFSSIIGVLNATPLLYLFLPFPFEKYAEMGRICHKTWSRVGLSRVTLDL